MDYKIILSKLQERWQVEEDWTWTPICWELNIPWVCVYNVWDIVHELKAVLKNIFSIDSVLEINEDREAKEIKIDEIDFVYDWIEKFYTDTHYSFLIYVSHENTITIGSEKINQFIMISFTIDKVIEKVKNETPNIIKDWQERAVAFRIWCYLKELIENEKIWTVDMEYNRVWNLKDPKRRDTETYIIPDIIIHKRTDKKLNWCLVIIEVKISNSEAKGDFVKLKEFTSKRIENWRREIQYQYWLSISFENELKLVWFQNWEEIKI